MLLFTIVYIYCDCLHSSAGEAVDSKHLLKCIKESAKPCNDIHEVLQSIAKPSSEQPPDASNMDVSV